MQRDRGQAAVVSGLPDCVQGEAEETDMPVQAYIAIEGVTQGLISAGCNTADSIGNKYQADHEDEITVLKFEHNIIIPRDPQSGQPTGQRVHQPVIFTKRYDKSSPLLYHALCSGERLTTCTINWFRTTMEGTLEHYFTHVLEDALLVDIRADMVHCSDPNLAHHDHEETCSLTYRKITWKHEVAGTEGSDDWRAPIF